MPGEARRSDHRIRWRTRSYLTKAPDNFALLAHAPNQAIAEMWVSMLEEAGIQAYVPGKYLADEWGATQRLLGNVGADVFVARSRLEEAREVIKPDAATPPDDDEEDAPTTPSEAAVGDAPTTVVPPSSRRALLFEILAVCCVIVLPTYISSIAGLVETGFRPWRWQWSARDSVLDVLLAIPPVVLLLWVISRSGVPRSTFGWVRFRPVRDFLAGAAVFVLFEMLVALLAWGFAFVVVSTSSGQAGVDAVPDFIRGARRADHSHPDGALDWLLLVAGFIASALVEEFSMRGYLLPRVRMLLGSAGKAAVISAAVWAGAHIYQGVLPVLMHFIVGLFLAAAFFILKRISPLVIAHAASNIVIQLLAAESL